MLENKLQTWSYITHPNKTYELVKNTGDLNKTRIGYFTDTESEMLTILEYLNLGEKTNITESMIVQIDNAIREAITEKINTNSEMYSNKMSTAQFIKDYYSLSKSRIAAIYYYDGVYSIKQYFPGGRISTITRSTIIDSRKYLKSQGYTVKYLRTLKDSTELIEVWI